MFSKHESHKNYIPHLTKIDSPPKTPQFLNFSLFRTSHGLTNVSLKAFNVGSERDHQHAEKKRKSFDWTIL